MIPLADDQGGRGVPWGSIAAALLVLALGLAPRVLPELEARLLLDALALDLRQTRAALTGELRFMGSGLLLPALTAPLLHGGIVHLFGNLWLAPVLAGCLERRVGGKRLLVFAVTCSLGAVVTVALLGVDRFVVVGASGVVGGILGGYLVSSFRARVTLWVPVLFIPVFVQVRGWVLALVFAVLQVPLVQALLAVEGYRPMGPWAALGGFATGCLLAPVLLVWRGRAGTLRR